MPAIKNRNYSNFEDHDLWEVFKSGDQDAYAKIYQIHADPLFKYGMHLCFDVEMVEDVIHDIFIDIWDRRENLAEVKSIRLYLKFSLRRRILRKLKKSNLFQSEEALYRNSFKFALQAESVAMESDYNQEMELRLINALNDLSPRQREVIYLRFYQDMTYEEIAEHLALDIGYVYNVTSRAYSKLKTGLCAVSLIFIFAELM